MFSGEGEKVPLGKNLKAGRKPVEQWLGLLEGNMKQTIRTMIKEGIIDYDQSTDRPKWIMTHFAQVVMCVSQIMWCRQTESVLLDASERGMDPREALEKWYEINIKQINDIMELIRSKLKPIDRRKIVALVTTDVHNRDVIKRLIDDKCQIKYLRF